MKCIDSVKPLRPRFPTKIPANQNISEICDSRWSHRPLYQYVFDVPLPAAEKLILQCVTSYREVNSNNFKHFGARQPDCNDIQDDTRLPGPVVARILKSLCDAGYLVIEGEGEMRESYFVEPTLPLFYEYFSISRTLPYVGEKDREVLYLQRDRVSFEISESLTLDARPLEQIAYLYPGLYRTHIEKWLRMESRRSI